MTLSAGTRLGPYEIEAAIGAGGPPSLNAACGRSSGGSTVAKETTR